MGACSVKDSTLRALIAMAALCYSQTLLWSLAFFAGRDGTITAGIAAMGAAVAGLGGYIGLKRDGEVPLRAP